MRAVPLLGVGELWEVLMEIKEIRGILGDNITEFSKRYNIPYPTILKWENGTRRPPEWVLSLLERVVREDSRCQVDTKIDTGCGK